jgi:hypothetical protein
MRGADFGHRLGPWHPRRRSTACLRSILASRSYVTCRRGSRPRDFAKELSRLTVGASGPSARSGAARHFISRSLDTRPRPAMAHSSGHVRVERVRLFALGVSWCAQVCAVGSGKENCVRTVSHTPRNLESTPAFTRTRACTSLLWEVVDRKCVGGISCVSARAAGVNFQACLIDRSSISPL